MAVKVLKFYDETNFFVGFSEKQAYIYVYVCVCVKLIRETINYYEK